MLGRNGCTVVGGGTGNGLPVAVRPRGFAPGAHDLLLLRNTGHQLSVPPQMRASRLHAIALVCSPMDDKPMKDSGLRFATGIG